MTTQNTPTLKLTVQDLLSALDDSSDCGDCDCDPCQNCAQSIGQGVDSLPPRHKVIEIVRNLAKKAGLQVK